MTTPHGWECRASGMRLALRGRVYRVRPVAGAWVATEQDASGVAREQAFEGRHAGMRAVETWAEDARARDDAAVAEAREAEFMRQQLSLLPDDDADAGRPESHSGLFARGGR